MRVNACEPIPLAERRQKSWPVPFVSSVPSSVTPSKSKRRFTLQEANRTLPLVSRIVRDIVATHQRASPLCRPSSLRLRKSRKSSRPAQNSSRPSIGCKAFVDELAGVGVELKDYQIGLVDFVGRHQGRDVYLCWKLGEESIKFWHELHTGVTGRQPINTLDEKE